MQRKAPIAIVGMGCRFPQAPDLAAYWRNIREARVCFSDVPADRWNHALFFHPSPREIDKSYASRGGFIDDVRSFAALHYGLSPLRVRVMDPQHRLLVEAARATLSDAGWETRPFNRAHTGVFIGASVSEHKDIVTSRLRAQQLLDGAWGRVPELPPEWRAAVAEDVSPTRAFTIAGNLLNMMAATVAQVFDLGGPAFTIDAACSSALVAIYEAILHLRAGQCDAALAGGVYLNLTPDNMVGFSRIGAISRSDRCRPFDAAADGFVLGEGVGVVLLKRLEDAQRDGDRIHAVIRGAGINNDGHGEGPMTPRQGGQRDALDRAYGECDFTPDTVGFIEAHGTATGVGDVVEVAALKECYAARSRGPIDTVLSSVKANVGHTMSAAGAAGLIKAALVLSERTIPPQAAFETQNPALDLAFEDGRFRIATHAEPWLESPDHPRRAAVSSFGFGGTNCHLVLEEAPPRPRVPIDAARPEPFVISAPTVALLERHLGALQQALTEGEAARAPLADLARTLSTRSREKVCVGFVAASREELAHRLEAARGLLRAPEPVGGDGIRLSIAPLPAEERKIAFVFPGQGAQAVGLCQSLYRRWRPFRERFDELLDPALRSRLYPEPPFELEAATAALTRTEICQPIMAALGIALADSAAALGIRPAMTIGHSLGEFAALAAAGVLDRREAVRFVADRGALMAGLAGDAGAMAAVAADRAAVSRFVESRPDVVIANLNQPQQVVISGASAGVDAVLVELAKAGVQATRLAVSHAFHSPVLKPVDGALSELVRKLDLHPPMVPVISCIEPGAYPEEIEAVRQIMIRHATAPVDFVEGVRKCAEAGARIFVQVGAGTVFLSMARATLRSAGVRPAALVTLAATEADENDGARKLCESLAELAVLGVPVDFHALYQDEARPVSLPATPLETEQYWIATREERPPLTPLGFASETQMKSKDSSTEAMVALFREQTAVLQQQSDIIRKQAEALAGATGQPIPAAIAAAPPAPTAPPIAAPAPPIQTAPTAPATSVSPAVAVAAPGKDTALESRVLDVVARVSAFPRASVRPDQRLIGDLGFDSLMAVDLTSGLTEAFPGLDGVPRSLFVESTSVGEIVAYVQGRMAQPVAEPAAPTPAAMPPSSAPAGAVAPIAPAPASTIGRYSPTWVPARLGARPVSAEAPFAGPVVILPDSLGVASLLARRLVEAGCSVAIDGPETLLGNEPPRTIIDLRALARPEDVHTVPAVRLREPVEAAFHLARMAARVNVPSCFAVAFSGDVAAGLAGFSKALAREWPQARVKSIELDATLSPDTLAESLATELLSGDSSVEVRWLGVQRQTVDLASVGSPEAGVLRTGTVVAISGGAGGIGSRLAIELARRSQARVILLGRSAANEAVASLLTQIAAAGGEGHYVPCDIRDESATSAALAAGRARFGAIEAVVHAAGLIADGPLSRKRDEDFARVFDTKVAGLLSLWRATAADPLRSFVICTSWAGRFGNAQQTDYSAANHCAARLAAVLGGGRPGVRVAALDLPPWDGTPMVRTIPDGARAMMRADGVPFLSDRAGLDLILCELASGGASGELLIANSLPVVEQVVETLCKLTLATHPYLDDHRIEGKPVLPMAAAMDFAAEAALRVLGHVPPGAVLALRDFELLDGVVLNGEAVWLQVRAARRGDDVSIDLRHSSTAEGKRAAAYRCRAALTSGGVTLVPEPAVREKPALALAQFYARHTFHGPRLQGIIAVDDLGAAHIAGRVRASRPGELTGTPAGFTVDTLLVDASFQLALYWAHVRHGRAALPLGFAEYRALAPVTPGEEIRCLLAVEKAQGDLLVGQVDFFDGAGRLVAQLRGMRAQLRQPAAHAVELAKYRVEEFPEYLDLRRRIDKAAADGLENPYFRVHDKITRDTSFVEGHQLLHFSGYNYLGLSGNRAVTRAVGRAARRWGTSVSASRVASGEKPIHRELEAGLARFLGCEDAIVLVGGHATNLSVIGQICGPGDLVIHDSLAHDSIMAGAKLSGAGRRAFPHNDWEALDRTLTLVRPNVRRVLIAIEGVYSMDGDIPPLPEIIEVKKRHKALLLVDEAHSLGVLGRTGRGVGEHFGVARGDVELWMGTLSKSLASCGGYIAGSKAMVEYLKYSVGGFVYSVGMTPQNAAAALAALQQMEKHPELVTRLQQRARYFLEQCRARGINTGMSDGSAVIPCIVGHSDDCMRLAQAVVMKGINVQPILYPAVEEKQTRLRFFVTNRHSEKYLKYTAETVAAELRRINPAYLHVRKSATAARPESPVRMGLEKKMSVDPALRLYERSLAGQWNADRDLDWKQPTDVEPGIQGARNRLISELYWSEQESLRTVMRMNIPIQKYFKDDHFSAVAAAHTFDESRHAYVLERYCRHVNGLGECPTLWRVITRVADLMGASVENYFYSILVSETLGEVLFAMIRKSKGDALLKAICENALRDESRHIAYVTEGLRRIHPKLNRLEKLRMRVTLEAMIYFGLRSLRRTEADAATLGIGKDDYLDHFERKLNASIKRAGVESVLSPDRVTSIVAGFHTSGWKKPIAEPSMVARLHAMEDGHPEPQPATALA